MNSVSGHFHHPIRNGLSVLCGLVLLLVGVPAMAGVQALACTASPAGTNIQFPAVSASPATPNGSVIGNPVQVTMTFNCTDAINHRYYYSGPHKLPNMTVQAQHLAAVDNATVGPNGGIMFHTSIPGLDLELTATPNPASAGPNGPGGSPGWELGSACPGGQYPYPGSCTTSGTSFSATFTARLIKVGPVTAGTFANIALLDFTNYAYGYTDSYTGAYGAITVNSFNVSVPTCSVTRNPTEVTLPVVLASAFNGNNHPGETPFTVELSCPAGVQGANLSITLDANAAVPALHGVIQGSSGAGQAQGVGVQVLDGNGQSIDFGTAIPVGTINSGSFAIPLKARYFQTGGPVGAGQVQATATYTLTYP